ncbi:MAG: apolipoprotein N-acyltransferase [Candidatus Omnitrophica bacterium]|nr:apolipoprotein N-acyltransferase [Candidatus Omnitrophota bacterium]
MPRPLVGLLGWVGLVPLIWAATRCTPSRAFSLGYFAGLLFFLGTLYWVSYVSIAGTLLLVCYLALYPAAFALGCQMLNGFKPLFFWLCVPTLWVALELVRGILFTGFPWGLLAYTQSKFLPVIQIADVFGAYGVSWLVAAVNAAIFLVIVRCERAKATVMLTTFLLTASLAYGYLSLHAPSQSGPEVAVVQGNIPQEEKWEPDYAAHILGRYDELTRLARERHHPDLIIWPETAFPGYYPNDPQSGTLAALAQNLETPLLIGSPVLEEGRVMNSALLFNQDGALVTRYDKIHLVPFGEYLPLGGLFSFLKSYDPRIGEFSPGTEFTVFETGGTAFSILICFEDIFPGLARQFVRRGARFLVNITNDAWFGDTAAPHQHLEASIFRAVENGVSVVRSANTGVSCVIDPWGRVTAQVAETPGGKLTFVEGVSSARLYMRDPTCYTRVGDIFAWTCLAGTILALGLSKFVRLRNI